MVLVCADISMLVASGLHRNHI